MAKEKKDNLPAVKVDITVNAGDVVAIKVSEFEATLLGELSALKNELKNLEGEAKGLETKLKEACQKVAEDRLGKVFEETKKAFATLSKSPLECELKGHLQCGGYYNEDEEKTLVRIWMSVHSFSKGNRLVDVELSASRDEMVPPPASVKSILEAQAIIAESIAKNREETTRNRADMDKIPALERAVRAAIAKEKLKGLDDDALVKLMRGVSIPGIKALPPAK